MADELDKLLKGIPRADSGAPEPARVHIAPHDVPPYVRRLRRMLEQQVRAIRAHPNTETAAEAASKRDAALGRLRDLRPQVDDAMMRAEIDGLITYFRVVDRDG